MISAKIKPKKIEIDDMTLYMIYDIKTAKTYKKRTGKSLIAAISGLKKEADELEFAEMIVCCLRETPKGECLELDYFDNYNPISLMWSLVDDFKEQIMQGLSEEEIELKSQLYKAKVTKNGNKKKK